MSSELENSVMHEEITIQNLKCGGCANTIINKVGALAFVVSLSVDVDKSLVSVKLTDSSKLDEVKKKLSDLGYPEENDVNNLGKKAKSFVSCAVGRMSK